VPTEIESEAETPPAPPPPDNAPPPPPTTNALDTEVIAGGVNDCSLEAVADFAVTVTVCSEP